MFPIRQTVGNATQSIMLSIGNKDSYKFKNVDKMATQFPLESHTTSCKALWDMLSYACCCRSIYAVWIQYKLY